MRLFRSLTNFWGGIRGKMLILFAFFSVASLLLIGAFSVAVLNVVIRRESAFLVEEQLNAIIYNSRKVTYALLDGVPGCVAQATNSPLITDYLSAQWPDSHFSITAMPKGVTFGNGTMWGDTDSFAGIVEDRGAIEIRSFDVSEREKCSMSILVRIPFSGSFLQQLSRTSGLQIVNTHPTRLLPYRAEQGVKGEIVANFIPGSQQPVPVVVVARNLQTGRFEDWVVCQVRPSYTRTVTDLSHMGLRTSSWVAPLGSIALALVLVYACGMLLSLRLSQRIVAAVDGLSHAAFKVGKGDFSVRVAVPVKDQIGMLISSFNKMTSDLETLREQEKQAAVLERDIALAREVQQHLYPRTAALSPAADVWGVNIPARIVSGDLYDFFTFNNSEVGLLCADVSGKGVSAALMMAHLQALVHGHLLASDKVGIRPTPAAFVAALNRDLQGRFGNNRYATMFYGEFDSNNNVLRYINAGHCPSLLISEIGEATKLPGGDLPIGLFPEITYQERQVTLSKGSVIVVYTDGVTDALSSQGEEFGEERLLSCCTSLPKGANAEAICTLLSSKLAEWSAGVEQFDDTTILALTVE